MSDPSPNIEVPEEVNRWAFPKAAQVAIVKSPKGEWFHVDSLPALHAHWINELIDLVDPYAEAGGENSKLCPPIRETVEAILKVRDDEWEERLSDRGVPIQFEKVDIDRGWRDVVRELERERGFWAWKFERREAECEELAKRLEEAESVLAKRDDELRNRALDPEVVLAVVRANRPMWSAYKESEKVRALSETVTQIRVLFDLLAEDAERDPENQWTIRICICGCVHDRPEAGCPECGSIAYQTKVVQEIEDA